MIFDHRTYTCRYGAVKNQFAHYEKNGFEVQSRHLGKPLLYASTDVGDVNSYVHVWVYDSAEDRAAKRAAMMADPDWQAYLKMSAEAGYVTAQENKILIPAPFYEMPGK